jgi:hypothetical protein
MSDPQLDKILKDAIEDANLASKKSRPKWMGGAAPRERLSESGRRKRRKLNKANAKLRPKVRKRSKHGRQVR